MQPDAPWTRGRFLRWCREAGLRTGDRIATVFSLTTQTLRNWAKRPSAVLPARIALCVRGYEAWVSGSMGNTLPVFPRPTRGWFEAWCAGRGIGTYAAMGRVFGLTRQTVHRWFSAGLPLWLPLACLGVEASGTGNIP